MHELSIAQSLLDAALAAAAEHGAGRIRLLRLRIGGLRQIVEDSLRQGFAILSAGSIAEDADLQIDWIPSVWRCAQCGQALDVWRLVDGPNFPAGSANGPHPGIADNDCPCGGRKRTFEGSDDLLLTSMVLECDDED